MKSHIITLLISCSAVLFSCEKVIDVDLNESEPKLVIEAVLQAGPHDFTVLISETTSYFDSETAVLRDDAQVQLMDNAGLEVDIPLVSNGRYSLPVDAEVGRTYTLAVSIAGARYLASAEVPEKVTILELEYEFREGGGPIDEGYQLFSRFTDDPTRSNYYRNVHAINGVYQLAGEDLQVIDDNLFDGSERARLPIFQRSFDPGATVTLVLQHIDENSFEYLNSLADIIGEDGGPNSGSAAPGNPVSNWDGEILGYFGAFAADTLSVELPE